MLQQLRDQTQSTGFKILVVAIILVLTLFGFGATNIFMGSMPKVASVGDYEITEGVLSFETERERRRLLAQVGPDFDPNDIDRVQLQNYALNQLISRQVLYQAAEQVQIAFSESEVNRRLVQNPVYQVDGEFNEAIYRQQVQLLGFTPLQFMQEVRKGLGSDFLRAGVASTNFAQDWEVAQAAGLINQRRDIAYLSLDVEDYLGTLELSEDEVAARYEEDQSLYVTEPLVDVEWVEVAVANLQADVEIDDSLENLQGIYEADSATLEGDAQRKAAHILVVVDEDTDEAAALVSIQEAAQRLEAGEEFAGLAREISQDPGSAEVGGDIGLVTKSSFDPAFEDALWELVNVGEVTAPVRSEFGYHLIKLLEIVEAEVPTFAEAKDAILARLREEAAAEAFDTAIEELDRRAFEERYTLTDAAQAMNLTIQQVAGVAESTTVGDWALAANAEVLSSLFTPEGLDGENSAVIALDDGRAVVVRVTEYFPAAQLALADVESTIRQELKQEAALAQISAELAAALDQLKEGASVTAVANELNKRWVTYELISRVGMTPGGAADVPQNILNEAFALARPVSGDKTVGAITGPNGSALVVVTRVMPGDVQATSDEMIAQLSQQVVSRDQQREFAAFFAAAEQSVGVSRGQ